jgi:hypothetical protein
MKDAMFKFHFSKYLEVIDGVRTGRIPCGPTLTEIDATHFPSGVDHIDALRKPDGSMLIMFFTAEAFPLHHEGYVFADCKTNAECTFAFDSLKGKCSMRQVKSHWYYFSG